ncbi:MAG: glutamyl-tRNA reductase [Chloroflexi bacterium]|nr:glutamyl-tRNA reductase [Chloroflexota bacterium]
MNPALACIGLSHHTAPVELRERIAFDAESRGKFLADLENRAECNEAVVLSTCNRTEIYMAGGSVDHRSILGHLADGFGIASAELESATYSLSSEQAISHLLRVAAGLDSMVLGEPQILGQVIAAYETAVAEKSIGPALSKVFLAAIHAGKRVRNETGIARHTISLSSLAVALAQRHISDLADAHITLLGAGEMAELAIEAFRKRGATRCTVISRSLASACKLAERWQGEALTLDGLQQAVEATDILLCSSSAPHTLITKPLVQQALAARPARPLVILDIAVPRDVDPDVEDVPGVTLHDIDDLHQVSEAHQAWRAKDIPLVERILQEEYRACLEELAALRVVPIIKGIRRQGEEIRSRELEKTLRHLGDLTPAQHERIDALTQAIVRKLLHQPTVRLRQEAAGARADEYSLLAREMFGLDDLPSGNGTEAA